MTVIGAAVRRFGDRFDRQAELGIEGKSRVSHAAKTIDRDNAPTQGSQEADLLLFLRRTLQFHSSDAEKEDVFEKLQNLKKALDQQEATLSRWPDSPSKNRIRESLAQARKSVAQIVDDFGGAAPARSGSGDAQTS